MMAGKRGMNKAGRMGGKRAGAGPKLAPVGTFTMDCMPAMADVVSGAVKRPRAFGNPGERVLPYLKRTPAWPRVSKFLKTQRVRLVAARGSAPLDEKLTTQIADVRELIDDSAAIVTLWGGSVLVAFNVDGTRAAVRDVPRND